MYQPPKCPYSYSSKAFEFYLRMFFPASTLNSIITPFIFQCIFKTKTSHSQEPNKKAVLKSFTKLTRNFLHRSLFLIMLQLSTTCNFVKKEAPEYVFSCEKVFCRASSTDFFLKDLLYKKLLKCH